MTSPAGVLELQGAEVGGVQAGIGRLRLRLAAAPVRRDGEDGFLLGATLCFAEAQWQGQPAACFGNLAHGEVRHGGARLLRLPVDFASGAPVSAEFVFHNGEHLRVEAAALHVEVPGDARWLPSLAC